MSVPGNVERAFVREVELRPVAGARRVEVGASGAGATGEAHPSPVVPGIDITERMPDGVSILLA